MGIVGRTGFDFFQRVRDFFQDYYSSQSRTERSKHQEANSLKDRRRGKIGRSVMAIAVFAAALIALVVVVLIIFAVQRQLRKEPRSVPHPFTGKLALYNGDDRVGTVCAPSGPTDEPYVIRCPFSGRSRAARSQRPCAAVPPQILIGRDSLVI
jgi:hypothetical protein